MSVDDARRLPFFVADGLSHASCVAGNSREPVGRLRVSAGGLFPQDGRPLPALRKHRTASSEGDIPPFKTDLQLLKVRFVDGSQKTFKLVH